MSTEYQKPFKLLHCEHFNMIIMRLRRFKINKTLFDIIFERPKPSWMVCVGKLNYKRYKKNYTIYNYNNDRYRLIDEKMISLPANYSQI